MLDMSETNSKSGSQERLEKLVEFFWKGGSATAKELAERFDVSTRTIQNDLKRLHLLEKEGWRYYLPDRYRRLRPYEKAEMSAAMMMAMFDKAVPSLGEYSETLLTHLPKNRDIFLFDFAFEEIEDEDILAIIVSIIEKRMGASFDYTDKHGKSGRHYTFPVKIANFNGYWYLLAYDAVDDRVKSFHINDMVDIEIMDEDPVDESRKDELHRSLSSTVSSWVGGEMKRVRLMVEGDAVRYFRRKSYDMIEIVEDNGDSIVIEAGYFNDIEILRLLSKWLPFVSILDDEALKRKMRERLEISLKRFSS
jgi:predicted DNA-binding transcriptional regulator YafY